MCATLALALLLLAPPSPALSRQCSSVSRSCGFATRCTGAAEPDAAEDADGTAWRCTSVLARWPGAMTRLAF
ncbi:hypothetical protein, partial [Streptomyces sp. WAC05950]|uniref:hypothetical protein n=1 Tax=Streptomyces sp. WAC05950 TaxID=2487419 RepID=UPI001C8EF12A